MPRKPPRPSPASCTSGRFPWAPIDRGEEHERAAAYQQALVAQWIVRRMTQTGLKQRDLERAGVASQSAISGLLTGKSWTDMWVVARIVAYLGGRLKVEVPPGR